MVEEVGIGNFIFYASVNEQINLSANIVNNPVEDGSLISDHIINNPIQLTIEGEISDIYYEVQWANTIESFLGRLNPGVGILSAYSNNWTKAQLSKINNYISTIETTISTIENLKDKLLNNEKNITEQFFDYLNEVYKNKELITIRCSDRFYENMAIQELIIRKIAVKSYSFSLKCQEVRIAETKIIQLDKKALNNDVKAQVSNLKNKGTQQGKKVEKSLLYEILH